MKISCDKDQLQYAVQTVQKALASKTPLPILTGIYMEAKDNKLEMQATDYEIGISCTIGVNVEQAGSVVLSGRYLQELVRKLPGETVAIASGQEDHTIKITSEKAQFNLLSLPPEEFPVLKPVSGENTLVIKDYILRELIKKTVFACATDEARPIFTGGLLEVENDQIRMVATNTHRLAFKKEIVSADANIKMIIPAKILNELARILTAEEPQDVTLSWHKNQVGISFGDVYINSRLIEGQFPDYNKVIPASYTSVAKINTGQFTDAVERVSLFAREGEYNVVRFGFAKDGVTITSNNPDVGKAFENVEAELEGNPVEITFNAKYIIDILKNITAEKLVFSLNSSLSPANIKPLDDENYVYIITPVRTN